jgi:hypothetical protein
MWKAYVLLFVAVVAVVTGAVGFLLISWAPVPDVMEGLGVYARYILPVAPSAVLMWVGAHVFLRYARPVPPKTRFLTALAVVVLTGAMWLFFYAAFTSPLPLRHLAFNYGFYLLPATMLAMTAEFITWLRHD